MAGPYLQNLGRHSECVWSAWLVAGGSQTCVRGMKVTALAVSFGLWAQNVAGVIPWKKSEPVALGTVVAGYGSSAWALARLGWAVIWLYPQVLDPLLPSAVRLIVDGRDDTAQC